MTDLFLGTSGPRSANLAIVGESWGSDEARAQAPFVGQAGQELNRMLAECGINRDECFVTNVIPKQPLNNEMALFFYSNAETKEAGRETTWGLSPSDEVLLGIELLIQQLEIVKPNCIVALGNYALWALSQDCADIKTDSNKKKGIPPTKQPFGITKWRGSQLYARPEFGGAKLVPLYHPAGILRQWAWRYPTINDLKRRVRIGMTDRDLWPFSTDYKFHIAPTLVQAFDFFDFVLGALDAAPTQLSVDSETYSGYMDCLGIAVSDREAICIPFVAIGTEGAPQPYWSAHDELSIRSGLQAILQHPNARIIGQNFLYDMQYLDNELLGIPQDVFDTMLAQHVCWPGTPKALEYLSSLYCRYHRYWKDEGKVRDNKVEDRVRWEYNCKDVCATFESKVVLRRLISQLDLEKQWQLQCSQIPMVFTMMLRGARISQEGRDKAVKELSQAAVEREAWLADALPAGMAPELKSSTATPWYRSPIQQQHIFYSELGLKEIRDLKTHSPTVDDAALELIGQREPLLLPITDRIRELRSLKKFHEVCTAPLDPDGRMRCSFNIAGTKTYRWSSSANAFGRGTNLQNLSKGHEE